VPAAGGVAGAAKKMRAADHSYCDSQV